MHNSPVISLAILQVNWDTNKTDYVNTFVPLVIECINRSKNEYVVAPEIKSMMEDLFSLVLPYSIIDKILTRLKQGKLIENVNGAYKPIRNKLGHFNFKEVQTKIMNEHDLLIRGFIDFCDKKHNIRLERKDAEEYIHEYLENNQILILNIMSSESIMPNPESIVLNSEDYPEITKKYLVGAYICEIQDNNSIEFNYLERVLIGNLLANAIFLSADLSKQGKKFENTEIFFDTSFLLHAVGHGGDIRKAPCLELLNLLKDSGARLRCFRHTYEEARNVLESISHVMEDNPSKLYGPSVEHFLANRYTSSDIYRLSLSLKREIEEYGISIQEKPDYHSDKYPGVIDEKLFEEYLLNRGDILNYKKDNARRHDVESIAAIMRLRQNRIFYSLEECNAIFITTNSALAKSTKDFFKDAPKRSIFPCITDYTITNLLWLKNPTKAPNLPKKRLIADYYAAIQPSPQLWRMYLDKIALLQRENKVTEDEYFLLRHSIEAKDALMELTLGRDTAFTEGTPQEVLEIVRSNIEKKVIEESNKLIEEKDREIKEILQDKENIEKTIKEKDNLINYIREDSKKVKENIDRKIEIRARKYANVITKILHYLMLTVIIFGTYYTFPFNLPSLKEGWSQYIPSVLLGIMFTVSIFNTMFGIAITQVLNKFEEYLAIRIRKFLSME